jgi:hypothetical protein
MVRAAKLQVNLYEEVEADTKATGQAFLAVVIVSIATGIGAGISGLGNGGLWFLWGLMVGLVTSIVGWLAWAFFTYIIGTKLFKGPETSATWGELLRTIGFSTSPGVLRIFSFIPFLGGIISFGASIWSLIAGVIAVRQALDFSTGRAIVTCIVGWIIYMLIVFLVTTIFLGAVLF